MSDNVFKDILLYICIVSFALASKSKRVSEIHLMDNFQSQIKKMEYNVGNIPQRPNFTLTLTAKPDPFETSDPTTQAKVVLRSDLFDDKTEKILYYAFLITKEEYSQPPENGYWNQEQWPNISNWENPEVPYEVTPEKWKPFKETTSWSCVGSVSFILGDGSGQGTHYWNKPLSENSKYAFKIRAFTASAFQDTDVIYFATLKKFPLLRVLLILGSVFFLTGLAVCFSIFEFESSAAYCLRILILGLETLRPF